VVVVNQPASKPDNKEGQQIWWNSKADGDSPDDREGDKVNVCIESMRCSLRRLVSLWV